MSWRIVSPERKEEGEGEGGEMRLSERWRGSAKMKGAKCKDEGEDGVENPRSTSHD